MHDGLRVGGRERARDLDAEREKIIRRERSVREELTERPSVHEFEDEEHVAVLLDHVVDHGQVRIVEPARAPDLAQEPGARRGILAQPRRHALDRDVAVQAVIPGAVDLAHAARPQLVRDDIATLLQALADEAGRGRGAVRRHRRRDHEPPEVDCVTA